MSGGLIAALVLALVVAAALWVPFAEAVAVDSAGDLGEWGRLHEQKTRCLQVLRDLELDNATGKVSPTDYEQTKTRLRIELAEILERIEGAPRS